MILLRIGIIGLKDWLHWVGVLVGSLGCKYGWLKQILKYIILLCPLHTNQEVMLLVAGIKNYYGRVTRSIGKKSLCCRSLSVGKDLFSSGKVKGEVLLLYEVKERRGAEGSIYTGKCL